MQTAHEIVASFIAAKGIDMTDFNEWFRDGGYSQDEANIHDSRYLHLLETFVEERDADRAFDDVQQSANDWCDINGGGVVTPEQIKEMQRRQAEREGATPVEGKKTA